MYVRPSTVVRSLTKPKSLLAQQKHKVSGRALFFCLESVSWFRLLCRVLLLGLINSRRRLFQFASQARVVRRRRALFALDSRRSFDAEGFERACANPSRGLW